MKKLVAFLVVFSVLASLMLPLSAEGSRVNVMSGAVVEETYGLLSNSKYVPGNMWDGINTYNADISATYCDFKFASSAADAMSATVPKYNIYGLTGAADSIYLSAFRAVLDKVYTVNGLKFFGGSSVSSSNIDGFDIWVSETGIEGSWTKVYSDTELLCQSKYLTETVDGMGTFYVEKDFNDIKVQYIIFGLTQSRCQHTDELAKIGMTPNANPHYFRICEIEMYGPEQAVATTETHVTTEVPVTTEIPVTSEAPVTTETPATAEITEADVTTAVPTVTLAADDTGSGGCGGSIGAAMGIISVIACAFVALRNKEEK